MAAARLLSGVFLFDVRQSLAAHGFDQAGSDFLLGSRHRACPSGSDRGAGEAESRKVRRGLGGQVHFLGRFRARLGGHAHVDEGLLRSAIQSPAENDLVQLADDAEQVGFDLIQDLLPLRELFARTRRPS